MRVGGNPEGAGPGRGPENLENRILETDRFKSNGDNDQESMTFEWIFRVDTLVDLPESDFRRTSVRLEFNGEFDPGSG